MSTLEILETLDVHVTVFSRPACVQCDGTYRALDAKGINFTIHDVSQDPEALENVKRLGYLQAPVAILAPEVAKLLGADDESIPLQPHWSGFRPDQIDLAAQLLLEKGVTLVPRDPKEAAAARKAAKAESGV